MPSPVQQDIIEVPVIVVGIDGGFVDPSHGKSVMKVPPIGNRDHNPMKVVEGATRNGPYSSPIQCISEIQHEGVMNFGIISVALGLEIKTQIKAVGRLIKREVNRLAG